MIIEDSEAFKTWLTVVLKPICEADPGALAKYVFALVKKDKSPEALRQSMVSQLEVFLQHETEAFVNLLFTTLDSKDYLIPVIPSTNPPNPNIVIPEASSPPKLKELKKEIIPLSELPSFSDAVNGTVTVIIKDKEKPLEIKRDLREIRKSESEKEQDKPAKRLRHRSLSRNRSRSRSWDRNKRSRSKEKSRERDRELYRDKRDRPRPYRNKSPIRRYERRRSRSLSAGRLRSRSRSPRHNYRGRYRNRSPPRSASRSRSRSLDRKDRKDLGRNDKDAKDSNRSGAGTPTQDSNHGDMDLRLTNTTQSIQSVVVHHIAGGMRSPKKRCRDYDEKGFCMRGEMCPYDHGMDPVVLEDTALTRVLTFGPNGAPMNDVPPPMIPPPIIGGPGHPVMHHLPPRPLMPEYNPQAPQMWHRPGFRGPRAMLGPRPPMGAFIPQSSMQRELISVPVMDNQIPEQFGNNFSRQKYIQPEIEHSESIFKKKTFDYNRLGPRAKNPSNCSLELKKVPPGLNNITHLNNHFSKFGKIVNIQVFYEGDPEAAIVTFSSHAEANAAYRSTEAVLNNRFIKVFWHSVGADGKQENVPPRSIKDRLGVPNTVLPNSNKVLNLVQPKADAHEEEAINDSKQQQQNNFAKNNTSTTNKEETKAQAAAAIKKGQELLAATEKIKKNQEEKRKEALKITQDLRKRKQELLEKQLAQQKLLIEKMEKTATGAQRELLLQTIKKSQEATEAIRKDIRAQPLVPSKTGPQKKTKEEVQKEVLDAELDLITKQQEGVDTSELQKKVLELKAKIGIGARRSSRGRRFSPISRHLLTKNNLIDSSGLKGNIKGILGGTRKTLFQKHAVDHRPTRILVSGYEGDEQKSVLSQFSQFGEIVDYVSDPLTPSILFNYKTRKDAEVALLKGKNFQDRTLSITWSNNAQLSNQLSGRTSTRTVLVSESDDDHLLDHGLLDGDVGLELAPGLSEEALLHDDEEDDDDNEARSWRR